VGGAHHVSAEPEIRAGFVDERLAAEHPGLGLSWCAFAVAQDVSRRSGAGVRARLRGLSDRLRGADAIALRGRPVPHAYRVLFRSLGLDPDVERVPVEEYVLERLKRGGFPSRGVLADALAIACVETEVGVWAIDGPRATLGLALAGERVVVADSTASVVRVFGVPPPVVGREVVLYAIVAPGVPAIAVEEALWTAWDLIETG
jgi:hypothetical protein